MTACVYKKHTGRVALAISASLVGALSLGAMATPMSVFAESGITTQTASAQQAIFDSTVTEAIATNNTEVTFADDGSISVEASDEGVRGVYATELTVAGQTVVLTEQGWEDGDYTVNFYKKGDIVYKQTVGGGLVPTRNLGTEVPVTPIAVGDYTAVITFKSGAYAGCKKAYDFRITPAEIGEVTVVDKTGDDFVYDGEDQLKDAQVLIDGKIADPDDFEFHFYKKGEVSDGDTGLASANWAGDYAVKVIGKKGIYKGAESDWAYFTVKQLDLATADVVINDMTVSSLKGSESDTSANDQVHPAVSSVNGKTAVVGELIANFVGSPTDTVDEPGSYTFEVSAIDPDNPNIINSKQVAFNVVESMLPATNFLYNGSPMTSTGPIDARDGSYNTDLIRVAGLDGKLLDPAAYTITVKDADGNTVTDTNLTQAGRYTVTVAINMNYSHYVYGGKKSIEVEIVNGFVSTADVYFTYDGVIGGASATDTYDGTNLLDNLDISVYDDLKNPLTEGEDYDVVVKDKAGNVVDEVIDAGVYTVTVSSDTYRMSDETFTLTVSPVQVNEVRVSNLTTFGDKDVYPYTGSDLNVELEYKDADGNWKGLPSGTYSLVYQYGDELHPVDGYSVVDAVNKVGFYKIYVHQAEDVQNYEIGKSAPEGFIAISNTVLDDKGTETPSDDVDIKGLVEVSDQKVFADVENTFWGAQGIYDAVDKGYMSGYKGTTFFGPLDNLTRAQAAVVLFNMGTGKSVPETDDLYITWVQRGLAFPDADQWYAAELGWASELGIVEGYPNGDFGGDDNILREQFATMLRNYAAAKGEDVSVDDVDAALEGIQDADSIDDWARENVAWAVENGVMGAEGFVYANQPIDRAQAALMVTRYQPEKLSKDDYLIGNAR